MPAPLGKTPTKKMPNIQVFGMEDNNATRAALVRHPWAPPIWQQHLPGPGRTGHMEKLLRFLAESGLSPELAHHGFHAVNNHVLGYTLQEQSMTLPAGSDGDTTARAFVASLSADTYPHTIAHVHQHLDGDTASSFELVLDLILDGLVRLDTMSPSTAHGHRLHK